jgi:hypothetical protein
MRLWASATPRAQTSREDVKVTRVSGRLTIGDRLVFQARSGAVEGYYCGERSAATGSPLDDFFRSSQACHSQASQR